MVWKLIQRHGTPIAPIDIAKIDITKGKNQCVNQMYISKKMMWKS